MNLSYVFTQGDPVLIGVFTVLSAMSIISWYLIVWKAWALRTERRLIATFQRKHTSSDWPRRLQSLTSQGSIAVLLHEASALQPQLIAHDVAQNEKLLSLYLAQRLDTIRAGLEKGLTVLASIGSSAPFIGLFGTVWGIYGALTHISSAGNASLALVAGPMGEALVATAAGLFAAIPAVLAYNAFVRMNRLVIKDLRHMAEQMTLHLAIVAPKGDVVPLLREAR